MTYTTVITVYHHESFENELLWNRFLTGGADDLMLMFILNTDLPDYTWKKVVLIYNHINGMSHNIFSHNHNKIITFILLFIF